MTETILTDEKLNLFIDEQLDIEETDQIRTAILEDVAVRERVCQLKAVRELVGYAYEHVLEPQDDEASRNDYFKLTMQGIAAGLLIGIGVLSGWMVNEQVRASNPIASATDVFKYFKFKSPVDRVERRIVLHLTTGDIVAVNAALNEAEQLLASYHDANTPMRLDVVTYKEGINILRVDDSPYVNRIENLIDNNKNVAIYACQNSVNKARKKEGKDIEFMPNAITNKTAMELISERIDKGWVYIKV